MIPLSVGISLAVLLAILSRVTKFDKDRSYFATLLIIIATYYVLFAFMSSEALITEIVIASVFSVVALAGALRWPILLGIGILLHGVFDYYHGHFINNSGVPEWWPAFCAGFDIVFGIWVIYLIQIKKVYEAS
ncbi:MAG: DUF6010 family protein [Cycloclasticus sp.]